VSSKGSKIAIRWSRESLRHAVSGRIADGRGGDLGVDPGAPASDRSRGGAQTGGSVR
jgi:hypothetical protein